MRTTAPRAGRHAIESTPADEVPARLTVADSLRRYFPQARQSLDPRPERLLGIIACCRHGELGGHHYACACGGRLAMANSCTNRFCPTCGYKQRCEWKERISGWKLGCDYLHVVFTLPHDLNPLVAANERELYKLLMRCERDTLVKIAEERYGCQVGMLQVLHTWG
jgi:hypothetical protein